ncbi:hypothetical protein Pmani_019025 [Petrolisthes manimaculis]|uniref:RanBP2-type domain-containing protein n=1 Tax=Petrolisthes manimaculis TaxID=1843537 RepID=A0AAE1PII6_9EUCA|nr:hypothetical protein Pmani_019025 [Petrolisthes manimaculis]
MCHPITVKVIEARTRLDSPLGTLNIHSNTREYCESMSWAPSNKRRWRCMDPNCRTYNHWEEESCMQCGFMRMPIRDARRGRRGRWGSDAPIQTKMEVWMTHTVTANTFFGRTRDGIRDAEKISQLLGELANRPNNKVNKLVSSMVVGVKTDSGWVRGISKRKCFEKRCSLQEGWGGPQQEEKDKDDDDSTASVEYWHLLLLDQGPLICCPLPWMILVTRDLAGIEAKALQFTLTKIYPTDKSKDEGRKWLESLLTRKTIQVEGRMNTHFGRRYVTVHVGDLNINEECLRLGYGRTDKEDSKADKEKAISPKSRTSSRGEGELLPLFKSSSCESLHSIGSSIVDHEQAEAEDDENDVYLSITRELPNLSFKVSNVAEILLSVCKVRNELWCLVDPMSAVCRVLVLLESEHMLDQTYESLSDRGEALLKLPQTSQEAKNSVRQFWRDVKPVTGSKMAQLKILLSEVKNECKRVGTTQNLPQYTNLLCSFMKWQKSYRNASWEVMSAVQWMSGAFCSYSDILKAALVGRTLPKPCHWAKDPCPVAASLRKEKALGSYGQKLKVVVVPSLMREVENRIATLSSIKTLMERIEAVHGEPVESVCNAILEEEQGHPIHQKRSMDDGSSTPDIMTSSNLMGRTPVLEPDVSAIEAVESETRKDDAESKIESCKTAGEIPVYDVEINGGDDNVVQIERDRGVQEVKKIEIDLIENLEETGHREVVDGSLVMDVKEAGARADEIGEASIIDISEEVDENKVDEMGSGEKQLNGKTMEVLDYVEKKAVEKLDGINKGNVVVDSMVMEECVDQFVKFLENEISAENEKLLGMEKSDKTVKQEEVNDIAPQLGTIPTITLSHSDTSTTVQQETDFTSAPDQEVLANGVEPVTETPRPMNSKPKDEKVLPSMLLHNAVECPEDKMATEE